MRHDMFFNEYMIDFDIFTGKPILLEIDSRNNSIIEHKIDIPFIDDEDNNEEDLYEHSRKDI